MFRTTNNNAAALTAAASPTTALTTTSSSNNSTYHRRRQVTGTVSPRRLPQQNDLLKTIVLFCVLMMVSLTIQTLPHLQRTLDGTTDSVVLLFFTSTTTKSAPRSMTTKYPEPDNHSLSTQRNATTTDNDEQTASSLPCLLASSLTLEAHTWKLKNATTTTVLIEQPGSPICGKLRRPWNIVAQHHQQQEQQQKGSTLQHGSYYSTRLAQEIDRHQSNCSLKEAIFHLDNDYGLGSHLYLWSQALCNAIEAGYRIRTHNPLWLWRDELTCTSHRIENHAATSTTTTTIITADQSPLQCYFPAAEGRCPVIMSASNNTPGRNNYSDDTAANDSLEAFVNVTDPRNVRKRCRRVLDDPSYLTAFRAASIEYLFQSSISDSIVQEAQRQAALLFPNGQAPANMITVHIRWGDKFWEMDLVPIEGYIKAVETILLQQQQQRTTEVAQTIPSAHIYLATEDPAAVSAFVQHAPSQWHVYVDRTVTELTVVRPHRGNRASWTARNTKGRAGLSALASLLIAMEANDFVLTTKSNWSRLMNELRKNVIDPTCNNCTTMIDLRPGEW